MAKEWSLKRILQEKETLERMETDHKNWILDLDSKEREITLFMAGIVVGVLGNIIATTLWDFFPCIKLLLAVGSIFGIAFIFYNLLRDRQQNSDLRKYHVETMLFAQRAIEAINADLTKNSKKANKTK